MYKRSHILVVIMLSFPIVSPSVVLLWQDHFDIEISQDLGEEDTNKESKKDLEEKDTFLETFVPIELAVIAKTKFYSTSYLLEKYSFVVDINVPPPQPFI